MSNVWLLAPDTDASADASPDDHLVRVNGDDAEIARVTASGPEWLGSIPASSLGQLPGAAGKVDDPQVLIAVQGAASALVERGG